LITPYRNGTIKKGKNVYSVLSPRVRRRRPADFTIITKFFYGGYGKMNERDYFIGLDAGTDSIGWAVTDEQYRLQKARGQDMWGSYLFDPADTAEKRRGFRTARRRLARTHQRLMLLQKLFAEETEKVDPTFFIRLNDSKLFAEDKDGRIKTKYVLFGDENYNDKDYFKEYPTIFHLRSALIDGEIKDVRLLYLAVHHIIKNRGHFLFEGQSFNAGSADTAKSALSAINAFFGDREYQTLDLENADECLNIIKETNAKKTEKLKKLKELFVTGADKRLIAVVYGFIGGTINLNALYDAEEEYDVKKFSFDSDSFDDTVLPQIEKAVGNDEAELVRQMKAVYDWSVLSNIMRDRQYISQAKTDIYDKHKADLKLLKDYLRNNCSDETYKRVFRHNDKDKNYAAYIGMDKHKGYAKATRDDFYKFLKTLGISDEKIQKEIENKTFLPKQITNGNGIIPYQVNLSELKAILANAEKYFPFLKNESDGLTVSEKIISLMTFRIPYYVGPLYVNSDETKRKVPWAVRKEGTERVSVTPWNFDKVIDKDLSEEKFIQNMTCKCTYIPTEDVLPAASFLYGEYKFLNELNNLTVFGQKNEQARQAIIEYAKTHKKLSLKNLAALLATDGIIPSGTKPEDVFAGVDGDLKNNLASYIDFRRIIGTKADTESEMCEEIIKWITVVSDKKRLHDRIKRVYGEKLTEDEIKGLSYLKYKDWGRLSKKFLTEIYSEKFIVGETGEMPNIIDAMRISGKNLMQLLSDECGYADAVKKYNEENSEKASVTYNTVEELYCSPSVKRAIWRTVTLVREIVKIRGKAPKKIFIEMARGATEEQKHKRTVPRKEQILQLYKNIKDESRDWITEIENTEDGKFNKDAVFLYYTQMGKCMYTGENIAFGDLFDTNIYDIDHIYPQSKVKDDSLTNRVLVKKQVNAQKTDVYPVPDTIRRDMTGFWGILKKNNLINDEKFKRLTRGTPLSSEELADFIARQIVETQQSTKAAAKILHDMLPDTTIVYTKAKNAAEFKNDNKLLKIRDLNDFHHAKDAYVNIVVGNVLTTKYGRNIQEISMRRPEDYNIKNPYAKSVGGAWDTSYLDAVKRTYNKNTCTVVRFCGEGTGGLFNATIKTAGANDSLIPLKASGKISDTSKYGGYDSATTAYFMLVKSVGKKGKTLLSLECVTIYVDKLIRGDREKLTEFCVAKLGLVNPEIVIEKIKINTLFRINGSYAYIRGKTLKQILWCNANELILDAKNTEYLKHITSYFDGLKKIGREDICVDEKYDKIDAESNLVLYDALIEKLSSKVYAGLSLAGQKEFLIGNRTKFAALPLTNQCKVIKEILAFMQCNSVTSDLSLLDGVKNAGKILTSKFIQDYDIDIIYRSPTGYYTTVIDVNNLK
jgi:CRISPR-associated endonuclease Csn1